MVEASSPPDVDPADPAYVANPVTGERFLFHSPPAEPERDPLTFDLWAVPDMEPLATHVHPKQRETFTVQAGELALTRNDVDETFGEGETVAVPAGTPHRWATAGDRELHLTVEFEPGLAAESFLRDLAALARQDAVKDNGAPSLLQIAAMYRAYGYDLLYLANPPLRVQKVIFGAFGPIAASLGYRANPVTGRED